MVLHEPDQENEILLDVSKGLDKIVKDVKLPVNQSILKLITKMCDIKNIEQDDNWKV